MADRENNVTRVIVAGSRGFEDYAMLEAALDAVLAGRGPVEIVSGHARGADRLGERYAAEHQLPIRIFPADWKSHPIRAGFIRNAEMLAYAMEAKPLVVAFWDGSSSGTKDMTDRAEAAGAPCVIVPCGTEETNEQGV